MYLLPLDASRLEEAQLQSTRDSKCLPGKALDPHGNASYTLHVRRDVEIAARWVVQGERTLVPLMAAIAAGILGAAKLSALLPSLLYDVAFVGVLAGAVHALQRAAHLTRLGWSLSEGGRLAVFLGATVIELALLLLVAGILARLTGHELPAESLLGLLHLAAVAVLASRVSPRPTTAIYTFLALTWVVPALIPVFQPLLDVRRSFHPQGFPGWIAAVSPILALVLGALVLPARPASSTGTTLA